MSANHFLVTFVRRARYPGKPARTYGISPAVNSARNEGPECIEPAA